MLRANALRNPEKTAIHLKRVDLSKGGKHLPELKPHKSIAMPTQLRVTRNDALVALGRQSRRLENDRDAAAGGDHLHLPKVAVAIKRLAGSDERPRHVVATRRFLARDVQHLDLGRVIDQVSIARVHVHSGAEPRIQGAANVRAQPNPIRLTRRSERQQDGRESGNLALRAQHGDGVDGGWYHGAIMNPFKKSASQSGQSSICRSGNRSANDGDREVRTVLCAEGSSLGLQRSAHRTVRTTG